MRNNTLYLAHHGVQGQKWGVRRYQNPDGTLTEAGKAHYGKGESINLDKIDITNPEHVKKLGKKFNDYDVITCETKESSEVRRRLNNAAITGLKALEGPNADLSNDNKEWFLYEDQTIGFASVADLINRGYSKKQVKDAIKTAQLLSDADGEYWEIDGVFYLSDFGDSMDYENNNGRDKYCEKFIDNCIKYKIRS